MPTTATVADTTDVAHAVVDTTPELLEFLPIARTASAGRFTLTPQTAATTISHRARGTFRRLDDGSLDIRVTVDRKRAEEVRSTILDHLAGPRIEFRVNGEVIDGALITPQSFTTDRISFTAAGLVGRYLRLFQVFDVDEHADCLDAFQAWSTATRARLAAMPVEIDALGDRWEPPANLVPAPADNGCDIPSLPPMAIERRPHVDGQPDRLVVLGGTSLAAGPQQAPQPLLVIEAEAADLGPVAATPSASPLFDDDVQFFLALESCMSIPVSHPLFVEDDPTSPRWTGPDVLFPAVTCRDPKP